MKTLLSILILSLVIFSPLVHAANPQDAQLKKELEKKTENILDQSFFGNIVSLAGSSCNLYGLGIDLVNISYDGQWSIVDSALEVTVLFRNQPWRELIWAINDQREQFVKQLTALKKQRCVWVFAEPEAIAKNQMTKFQQTLDSLDRQIAELSAKIDYFGAQRGNMLFDYPRFGDFTQLKNDSFTLPQIPTDKIFYVLGGFTSLGVNWDQFVSSSKKVGMNAREDLELVFSYIPDNCFAVVTVGHELDMYFAQRFQYVDGMYRDDTGKSYKDFSSFVQDNAARIVEEYLQKYCGVSRDRALAEANKTSAEQQYKKFLDSLSLILSKLSLRLINVDKAVLALEKKRELSVLSDTESRTLSQLYQDRGRLLAMIDYHSLVLQRVGSAESQGLNALTKSVTSFVEAISGVISDDKGRKKSRLSIAERVQSINEKNLQNTCTRIEKMYREAGRSTSDLPLIGYANGKRYCRATTECADVNLGNLVGGSEGRKKLAECSGFLFNSSELGPSQFSKDVIDQSSEDLSLLLEQRALNDLLKQRNLHFASLRNRYKALYRAQGDTTVALEQILQDSSTDLYNPTSQSPALYEPNSFEKNNGKTHFSLMGKIYQSLWSFMSQQEGSCPAPKNPSF